MFQIGFSCLVIRMYFPKIDLIQVETFDSCTSVMILFLRKCISAVLSGTKYGLKQTRGKFGLGAKMVCSTIGLDLII